ncbi:hypothetical protein ACFTQ7_04160 [Lysinibacillus sp. NPDC056959]|uniref:hypothetical protein n=1 Tax=Lysinibacillus sp. NPDC056959 TaxID=3345981 RepID=UPI00363B1E80
MTRQQYPSPEGYQWINKNVDIIMRDGRKFCNVRFLNEETIVPSTSTIPGEYIWVFDDYSSGGAPIRRRKDPKDVVDKSSRNVMWSNNNYSTYASELRLAT